MAKRKTGSIGSGRALARELGVGESTVREYLARGDWPVARKAPWTARDVVAAKAWRRGLQEDRGSDGVPGADGGGKSLPQDLGLAQKVNLAAKNEQMLLTRVKRERLQAVLVDRSLLDRALDGLTRMYVGALDELERGLPYKVAGLDPGQAERVVREQIRAVRKNLASQTVIEIEQINQALASQAQTKARGRPPRKT